MKKMITAGVMAALSAAGLVAGAGSASAINRVTCNESGYTYMISPATTCWANAGTIGVTLYDVSAIASGNNTGWVASPSAGAKLASCQRVGAPSAGSPSSSTLMIRSALASSPMALSVAERLRPVRSHSSCTLPGPAFSASSGQALSSRPTGR